MKSFTPAPWRLGVPGGSIVGPAVVPATADEVQWYGGPLVAESVDPRNRPLIIEAPAMFACLHDMRTWGLFRGVYGAPRVAIIIEAERILGVVEGDV